jgi:hypothetical protein
VITRADRVACLVLLLCGAVHAQESTGASLRLRRSTVILEVEVDERSSGLGIGSVRSGTETLSVRLEPVAGEQVIATVILTRARGDLLMGEARSSYDTDSSSKPAPTGLGPPGQAVVTSLSARGEVLALLSVEGKTLEEAAAGRSRVVFEQSRVEHLTRFAAIGLQAPYPEEPVAPGSRWTSHCVRGLPGATNVRAAIENTVLEVGSDRVVVALKGEGRAGIKAEVVVTGRMVVSTVDGLPIDGEVRVTYTVQSRDGPVIGDTTRRWRRVGR